MKRLYCMAVTLCLIAGAPALAQQEAGDSELQVQGAFFLGGATDAGIAIVNYGRFRSEQLEVGLNLGLLFDSAGDVAGTVGAFGRWNFETQNPTTVPYAGASLNTAFGDFVGGDLLLTFEGGVRLFLKRNVAFNVAAQRSYDIDATELGDVTTVLFGFSYLWKD